MSKSGSTMPQKTLKPKKISPKRKVRPPLKTGDKQTRLWLLGSGLSLSLFFYYFHPIMMPFGVALIFAYALDPAVSFFEKKGLGRTAASSVMVFSILIFIAMLLFFTIPFLKKELQSLAITLPDYIKNLIENLMPKIQSWVSTFKGELHTEIQNTLTENISKMLHWVFTFLAGLFTNTLALANLVALVLLTPLLIFYLLRDWPKILEYIHNLVPHNMKSSTVHLGNEINATLSGYFRGQASVCLMMALYYVVALSVLGLNFAFTIGIVSGLLAFIPYVGFFTGFIAAIGVVLAQFRGVDPLFIIIGIYVFGHTVEAFILTPKLVGDRIGLHPVWVIFALLGGGLIMGFTGLLLAVPVSAILAVLLRFAINRYQKHLEGYAS